jgi:hypothetical protein
MMSRTTTSKARRARTDWLVATTLGVGYLSLLLRTVKDLGYARDEGFYFQAATAYGRWFEQLLADPKTALGRRAVDQAWSANHEHPALIKSLFALSHTWLETKLHLFAMEGTSFRFPAMVLASILVALLYLWGTEARGRIAGLGAAVFFAAMPRVFFQAHLACFDVPIVTLWTATAYAYWKAQRSDRRFWPIATGVLFGLALDTKHNAWFLPFALGAHAVATQLVARLFDTRDEGAARRQLVRAARALGAMAIAGPLVFYALWPWIWHDTVARLGDYAAFHLHHEYYNMEFFGETYFRPPMPRAYAPIMTLATVPIVTLALFAAGVVVRARAFVGKREPFDPAETSILWALGVFVNYAAWLRASTPIFGGTKHWMTAYPFIALFAGSALAAAVAIARREFARAGHRLGALAPIAAHRWTAPAVLSLAAFSAPLVESIHAHPWGLTAYTPLVGGAPGAATLGLNRGFWGYSTGSVAAWLNENAPRNASIYIHDTAGQSWDMLLRDHRIRRDIHAVPSVANADLALYHHEMHMEGQEYQAWIAFDSDRPADVAGLDGVPVIWVFKKK